MYYCGSIPSIFPLPDGFREKVSWGYKETAIHPITGEATTHLGIDIPAPGGTPVFAAAQGTIGKAGFQKGWGNLVVINHAEGHTSHYAHLDAIRVKSGDAVKKGEVIGSVGSSGMSTGPHLHYEVRKDGIHLDPAEYY